MNPEPTIFEFVSYAFDPDKKRIFFNYKQEFKNKKSINFTETLILPQIPDINNLPVGLLDKVLQGAHLILGISYYKCYCAPKIKINYKLSKTEANFWNVVYKNGLGEFFYKNKLDPKISPKFIFDKNLNPQNFRLEKNNKCLVGVSGGKDSIVAAELLKEQKFNITALFIENQREFETVNKVIDILELNSLKFRRILDAQVFNQHKYNGHIPVSAIYAFLGVLCSILYGYFYYIVANEHSSNFGNVKYKGIVVNHQWSKSFEFENMFQNYVSAFISPDIKYFSLLRPFYEIRIVEMFSKYKKYFPYFSSCNKNFTTKEIKKEQLWCGECAKCVFAFVLFSAFLSKNELIKIFKKNLYEDSNLLQLFKDILGLGKIKPFDCVGTFEESKTAFLMGAGKFSNSFIVRQLLKKVKIKKETKEDVFFSKPAPNIPSQFRFSGAQKVLILGYGKEGQISEKYIKHFFPQLKVGITDTKQQKAYLKNQHKYDLAIKTPGIPKKLVEIPYTTATNIFFARNKNLTIGITGSKGKSTTTSLIYEILKASGKNVSMLGNIGKPMLEALLNPVEPDKIFILELSSAQLEDLDFSPNIAVITNLFEEHMDYHGSVENYYKAKKNIINFQNKSDVFIYNPKDKMLCKWAKEKVGKAVASIEEIPLQNSEIPLIGEHNKQNIKLAITVAKEFNIPDEIIIKAIKNFKPLAHRLEFVGEFKGIKFYDDAISTTPESTIEAIKSLKNIDTIFLGGQDRGYNFSQLEKIIKKYRIKNIVLFPESGNKILKSEKGFNVLKTKSMQAAVKFAYKYTQPGKICLLSCASPSYSLWENFEEKGNQFQKFVKYFGYNK